MCIHAPPRGLRETRTPFYEQILTYELTLLEQETLPVVEVNGIRTVETALGKGICTLFHGSPAMFSPTKNKRK